MHDELACGVERRHSTIQQNKVYTKNEGHECIQTQCNPDQTAHLPKRLRMSYSSSALPRCRLRGVAVTVTVTVALHEPGVVTTAS